MALINDVFDKLVLREGGVNTVVAGKLSISSEKPISPQRIGQYRKGPKKPGSDFIVLWQKVYGDNIPDLIKAEETLVSRETKKGKKHTPVPEPALKKKDPDEEIRILIKNIDRIGATNEYLLKRIQELEQGSGPR